jgi:hypothetical protein
MPREEVQLHLEYKGKDVDDGTMSLEDLVPVIQGFSSAYGKIAAEVDPRARHRLRIVAVRQGSFDLILDVWRILGENVDSLTSAGIVLGGTAAVSTGAVKVTRWIVGVIKAKRHVGRRPFRERVGADADTVLITNADGLTIEIPLKVFELFKKAAIDADIAKMVRPLRKGHIDSAEIRAELPSGEPVVSETITADEKPLFDTSEASITSTKDAPLIAHLNSLTKTTNSGYLYLVDGTRVFYEYKGDSPARLHEIFSHDGPVRIQAIAHLDDSLKPVKVEITHIERAQMDLFGTPQIEDGGRDDGDG